METCWVVSEMKEKLYVGYLNPLFFHFYRKGLIGVWYSNSRNPVKPISPGLLGDTEAKPQYKER
jgi:hypothetical protein